MQASKLGRAGAVRRLAALARQHQHHVGLARIAGRLAHRQALQPRVSPRRAPRCPWNPAGAPNRSALAGRPAAPAPRGRCPARWPAAGTGRPARAAATAPRRPGDAAPAPTPRRRTARWAWAAARKPCRRPPARSGPCPPATDAAPRPAHSVRAAARRPASSGQVRSIQHRNARRGVESFQRRAQILGGNVEPCRASEGATARAADGAASAPVSANGKASAIARDILNAPDITRPRPKHAVPCRPCPKQGGIENWRMVGRADDPGVTGATRAGFRPSQCVFSAGIHPLRPRAASRACSQAPWMPSTSR